MKYHELQFDFSTPEPEPERTVQVLELNGVHLAELEMLGYDAINAMHSAPGVSTAEAMTSENPLGQMAFLASFGPVEVVSIETEAQQAIREIFEDPTETDEIHQAMDRIFGFDGPSETELGAVLDGNNSRAQLTDLFGDPDDPAFAVVSEVSETIADAYIEPILAQASDRHIPEASEAYVIAKRSLILAMQYRYRKTLRQPSLFTPETETV